jgi:predicted AAA+ superfamily ATPase
MEKSLKNNGLMAKTYFYRDSNGNEVDLLIQIGEIIVPVEIKLSKTFSSDFLKGIKNWNKVFGSTE